MNFRTECYNKLVEAFNMYGIDFNPSDVAIRVSITSERVAGKAGYTTFKGQRRYFIDFNARAIERYPDQLVKHTIPHEVAHLICYMNPKLGDKHDMGWKRVCLNIGGDGKRFHKMDLSKKR